MTECNYLLNMRTNPWTKSGSHRSTTDDRQQRIQWKSDRLPIPQV